MRKAADKASGKIKPHYAGHRERLRQRFLAGGSSALAEYELLELILFRAIPRRDVKPLAKALIDQFGSFGDVISAPVERLREISSLGEAAITELKIVRAAALTLSQSRVMNRPVLTSWNALIEYCTAAMAYQGTEQFRILFLDHKNILIADEVQQSGTVNQTPVYPREVVKRALELNASALVLAHNHPSGDPMPSQADIDMTKAIADAAKSLNITLHDHIIIGKGQHLSFRSYGLI